MFQNNATEPGACWRDFPGGPRSARGSRYGMTTPLLTLAENWPRFGVGPPVQK